MSSNELNFDKSNQMLQSERNCINFDGSKKLNLNYKAMSYDDACFVDTQHASQLVLVTMVLPTTLIASV
jgi:hypothetical protein